MTDTPTLLDRARGCLLGGALGDALGAPVEFLRMPAIRAKYGPEGIRELPNFFWGLGAWSDDTQMTLFTAEGLIRCQVRGTHRGICSVPDVLGYAYQRWLHTQGEPCHPYAIQKKNRGWLVDVPGLHRRRAPGNTCLTALRAWRPGQDPLHNDAKGCGTVMRSAPFGFFPCSWREAWNGAAITHGHLDAKATAAILAQTIAYLIEGEPMTSALLNACRHDEHQTDSARLVRRAIALAVSDTDPADAIRELGEGWVADEALGIAAYCAVRAGEDFERAVRLAVNHDGDSDSTGAITGNLMGAAYGPRILPERWLAVLELRDVIEQVATDLVTPVPVSEENPTDAERAFWNRYPGS